MTTPLWHDEAEQAVIGAMLVDADAPFRVAQILGKDDFYRDVHRVLFQAIVTLVERGAKVDFVALADELRRSDQFRRAGDPEYLSSLVDVASAGANVEHHARIVRDYAIRRALVEEAAAATQLAHDLSQPVSQSVVRLVDRLATAANPDRSDSSQSFSKDIWGALESIETQAKMGDAVVGVPSGITRLDAMTDGWVPGRLIVIAARPKKGKTAIAVHLAREACRSDICVYFATAEQPRRELVKRFLGLEANANLRAINSPAVLDMHAPHLSRAASEIKSWPIHIDEDSRTPSAVRLGVQRYQAEHGQVGLVVVDYLGKFHSGEKAERHDLEVGKISGAFAEMAMRLNVPVILLAQLNRSSVRDGQERRPTSSDLRDSGAIEQDAAQLMFLYRDPKADEAYQDPDWLQLILELNRFGPTGEVDVSFQKETGRWRPFLRLAS